MLNINYFQFVCFLWAAIGIVSRIAMFAMGEKWAKWELESAYKSKKPKWIYAVAIGGYGLIGFTWYKFFTTDIKVSWIVALLITLTVIKISTLLFNYDAFRKFAIETLKDKTKMFKLNIVVILFSITLVLMGVYLY